MTNRKIGALWSKRTKEGQEYFSGVISDLRGEIQIVVFKNDRKESFANSATGEFGGTGEFLT